MRTRPSTHSDDYPGYGGIPYSCIRALNARLRLQIYDSGSFFCIFAAPVYRSAVAIDIVRRLRDLGGLLLASSELCITAEMRKSALGPIACSYRGEWQPYHEMIMQESRIR